MHDKIQEILLLQNDYTSKNTKPMQRRGVLVRNELPAKIREIAAEIIVDVPLEDVGIAGNDGVGRKTEIPWTRVYSKSRSPRPTSGWYVVFLFSRNGERAYLSLIQGTTSWDGFEFKRRPEPELLSRSRWARDVLGLAASLPEGWTFDLRLEGRRGGLGEGYELGSVVATEYSVSAVPQDVEIIEHLAQAMTWLGRLYQLEDEGLYVPGDSAPEVADAQAVIENLAGKGSGQGFRLTAAERRAIEQRAVDETILYLKAHGYSVTNVGNRESYDLHASREDGDLFVEVKGTTSTGTDILLTRNEVLLHQERYPRNALAIVHSILLDRSGDSPSASGGTLSVKQPWQINEAQLTPIAFRYSVS